MKTNLLYYTHEVNSHHHPKFKILRKKYGWAGEGRFWALNNLIADSKLCILDLSRDFVRKSIAADLDLTLEEFEEFIQFLIHECELLDELNPQQVTTDDVQKCLDEVNKRRRFDRERKQKRADSTTETTENQPEKENSTKEKPVSAYKVKESKGSKGKKEKKIQGDKPPVEPVKKFVIPKLEDIQKEFKKIGYDQFSANIRGEKFFNHYQANGWKVGRNPMKDWKAAVHGTWNEFKKNGTHINGESFTKQLEAAQNNPLFK